MLNSLSGTDIPVCVTEEQLAKKRYPKTVSDIAVNKLMERPIRYTKPKKISDVVANLLAKKGYGRVLALEQYAELWLAAAGPTIAEKSKATDLKRGVLQIAASNSAVMQELVFQKKVLLKKLQDVAPEQKIVDLKIKVIPLS